MYILIIVAIISIAWAFAFYGKILSLTTRIISRIRLFIWENKTFVDIMFLITYSIIQLVFIIQINKPKVDVSLFVTLFVLALLTILGIERLFLKSRFNYLTELSNDIVQDYNILKSRYSATQAREKQLISIIKRLIKKNTK